MKNAESIQKMHKELKDSLFTLPASKMQIAAISSAIAHTRPEIIGQRISPGVSALGDNPMHMHDICEIIFNSVASAPVLNFVADREFTILPGEIFLLPAAVPHFIRVADDASSGVMFDFSLEAAAATHCRDMFFDWAYLRPWIHGGDLKYLKLRPPKAEVRFLYRAAADLYDVSLKLSQVMKKLGSPLIDKYSKELLEGFQDFAKRLGGFFYASCSRHELLMFEKYRPPMLAVLDYINEHLTGTVKLSDACACAGFKTAWFSKIFHEIMHLPMTEYINFIRIRQARRLLVNTTMPISEIGEACGYNSSVYFHRAFKAHTGCTPKIYRNEYVIEWQE